MNSIILQRYESRDSFLHQLDARVKFITTLLMIIGILLTPQNSWIAYPLLWTVLGILATIAEIGAWRISRLAGLALPFALAGITLLVTTPGNPITEFAGLTITDNGLARFLAILFKSWLSMQVALLLAFTTDFTDLLWALENLHFPATLITVIGLMYRYLFTLKDEAQRLLQARVARSGRHEGGKSGGSLLWRAQITGGMVGNLFLRSYERSERVYAAMLARGYNGHIRHREAPPLTWQMIAPATIPVILFLIIQIIVRL